MVQQAHAPQEQDEADQQKKAQQDGASGEGADKPLNRHPGGKDALGAKENVLAPYYDEMVAVAHELASQFTPLGLHFRPEILLATAMQEASAKDPLNARSFDN